MYLRAVLFGTGKNMNVVAVMRFIDPELRQRKEVQFLPQKSSKKLRNYFSNNFNRSETADRLGVKYDTLSKAIQAGRIEIELQEKDEAPIDKSSRSIIDYEAGSDIGIGCTRVLERRLAALGFLNVAESRFERL